MKKFLKFFAVFLLICTAAGAVISAPTVYRGYKLYQNAVGETPITVKAEAIMSAPDYTKLDDISDSFLKQMIKAEDKRFRYHPGFDPLAIARAAKNDLIAGNLVEGGSTITQQLAKNMYFDFGKAFERKIAEIFVAVKLERLYTKDEILEMYVNYINYGQGCFGISQAAEYYFGKTPEALTPEEGAALVYTIRCPEEFNPVALTTEQKAI